MIQCKYEIKYLRTSFEIVQLCPRVQKDKCVVNVSLLVIIYSYLIYLSIYLYQINSMFRYMFGVIETMGLNDLYGFIDPQLTQEGNKLDDIQPYVTKCFQRRKEIYFVPYVVG